MAAASALALLGLLASTASAAPVTEPKALARRWEYSKYFDLQAHRGGRGEIVESTLPAFADALKTGVTTLELDVGLTKDGHLIVWHDEIIDATKCKDTAPAFEGDELFPYVGRNVANLTYAQIETLDCGSIRLAGFPLQLEYPGTKLSKLEDLFDFVDCATDEPVLYNIETKINAAQRNETRATEDFVDALYAILSARGAGFIDRVTHQSFAWDSVIYSKQVAPELRTSALCDASTIYPTLDSVANLTYHGTGGSPWLNGIDIDSFNGTVSSRVAQAAASIGADYLSPAGAAGSTADPAQPAFEPFTTAEMVTVAHAHGLKVAPWTANGLNLIEYLFDECNVDGVITDYPAFVRKWALQQGKDLPPAGDEKRINKCFAEHWKRV